MKSREESVILIDRYLVTILAVMCVALMIALGGAVGMMEREANLAAASAAREHAALVREQAWRAGATAIMAGAHDTDFALKRSNAYLSACVARLAVTEDALAAR